jgi:hypothetical protein
MSVKEKTEVREANVLYIKTLLLARALHSKHIGFLVEYPDPVQTDQTSIELFVEYQTVLKLPGVQVIRGDQ